VEVERLMTENGSSAPGLRCELRRDNGMTTLRVEGELEEVSALELARACIRARDVAGDITLDLGGVAFADGTGTRMIGTMRRAYERAGHHMTIANVPARMRREVEAADL
jgi:anti-anti-sigma factor